MEYVDPGQPSAKSASVLPSTATPGWMPLLEGAVRKPAPTVAVLPPVWLLMVWLKTTKGSFRSLAGIGPGVVPLVAPLLTLVDWLGPSGVPLLPTKTVTAPLKSLTRT